MLALDSPLGVHAGNDPAFKRDCTCKWGHCDCPHPVGCGCLDCTEHEENYKADLNNDT